MLIAYQPFHFAFDDSACDLSPANSITAWRLGSKAKRIRITDCPHDVTLNSFK